MNDKYVPFAYVAVPLWLIIAFLLPGNTRDWLFLPVYLMITVSVFLHVGVWACQDAEWVSKAIRQLHHR